MEALTSSEVNAREKVWFVFNIWSSRESYPYIWIFGDQQFSDVDLFQGVTREENVSLQCFGDGQVEK
jgi:hypothetical protein